MKTKPNFSERLFTPGTTFKTQGAIAVADGTVLTAKAIKRLGGKTWMVMVEDPRADRTFIDFHVHVDTVSEIVNRPPGKAVIVDDISDGRPDDDWTFGIYHDLNWFADMVADHLEFHLKKLNLLTVDDCFNHRWCSVLLNKTGILDKCKHPNLDKAKYGDQDHNWILTTKVLAKAKKWAKRNANRLKVTQAFDHEMYEKEIRTTCKRPLTLRKSALDRVAELDVVGSYPKVADPFFTDNDVMFYYSQPGFKIEKVIPDNEPNT